MKAMVIETWTKTMETKFSIIIAGNVSSERIPVLAFCHKIFIFEFNEIRLDKSLIYHDNLYNQDFINFKPKMIISNQSF